MDERFAIGGDLPVRRMGYGAMRLCGHGVWGEPKDPSSARTLLRAVVEAGIELIDTSDAYGPEVNERQIREALAPYAGDLVIATKGGYTRPSAGSWVPNGRPEHLRAACEGSLQRLGLECIDLYQLHLPDPNVPFADSVGALAGLRAEGKIRHVGLSNVDLEELRAAQAIVPIASVQNEYNVGNRASDDVVDACAQDGIAFLPYFPIDGGDLAKAGGTLARIARSHAATPPQIALAWLLRRAPVILPIPGTASLEHLAENVAAAQIVLSDDEFAALG